MQPITEKLRAELPNCDDDLIQLYALLVLTTGVHTTFTDVHGAWALWRNQTDPEYPSLIPFDELPSEVQELDGPYRAAIIRVAAAQRPSDVLICIDASCPSCGHPERLFSSARGVFGCARCRYVSTEREV